MTTTNDEITEIEAASEEAAPSNSDRLLQHLKAETLAARLVHAHKGAADPAAALKRFLSWIIQKRGYFRIIILKSKRIAALAVELVDESDDRCPWRHWGRRRIAPSLTVPREWRERGGRTAVRVR
jgi:hypothetical protein